MEAQYKVEQIGKENYQLAEGPHWDDLQQALYFVDITACIVGRYDPISQTLHKATIAGCKHVGFVIPVEKTSDQFVVGLDDKISLIRWDGKTDTAEVVKHLTSALEPEGGRMNDGKADFNGRLVAGTMLIDWSLSPLTHKGVLVTYSPSENASAVTRLTGVGLSNGLAWNKSKGKMYYVDSLKFNVMEYDYDEKTGAIGNGRIVFDVKSPSYGLPKETFPDGMTIDSDGHLWLALYNGSRVIQIDVTSGLILQTVIIPAKQVTSVCWGGRNLDVLYVTTCSLVPHKDFLPAPAGGVFKVTGLNAKGLPSNSFRLQNGV